MTIGSRLRQRRLSLGYTLDELKDLIQKEGHNISKASLSKYELDKSIPKSTNLWYISRILNTAPDYFLRKSNFEINWIAFRKNTKLTKREEDRIRYYAKEQVEARYFLTDLIGKDLKEVDLPKFKINSIKEIELTAEKLRSIWKINFWPIESITSLLEEKGVFIVHIDSEKDFDGLSGYVDDKYPIIISANLTTIDRKRLNIAHELAHLILEIDDLNEESVAFRFAAALLIPKEILFENIGNKRKNIDIRELIILKEEFGISIQALIRRCFDLNIITNNEYKNMNILIRSQGLHINEPGQCSNKETPSAITSKLLRAISEGLTTESEVLSRFPSLSHDMGNEDMVIDLRKNIINYNENQLSKAAQNVLDEYNENGNLTGFEINDDIMDYYESSER